MAFCSFHKDVIFLCWFCMRKTEVKMGTVSQERRKDEATEESCGKTDWGTHIKWKCLRRKKKQGVHVEKKRPLKCNETGCLLIIYTVPFVIRKADQNKFDICYFWHYFTGSYCKTQYTCQLMVQLTQYCYNRTYRFVKFTQGINMIFTNPLVATWSIVKLPV